MTTDLDRVIDEVRELRRELFTLIGRVSRLEDRIEMAIEAPPVEKRIVPPSVVGDAAALGQEIAETRSVIRSARASAQGLRRVVAPNDDTGKHAAVEPGEKKP